MEVKEFKPRSGVVIHTTDAEAQAASGVDAGKHYITVVVYDRWDSIPGSWSVKIVPEPSMKLSRRLHCPGG